MTSRRRPIPPPGGGGGNQQPDQHLHLGRGVVVVVVDGFLGVDVETQSRQQHRLRKRREMVDWLDAVWLSIRPDEMVVAMVKQPDRHPLFFGWHWDLGGGVWSA